MKTLRIVIEATFEIATLESLHDATETINEAVEKLREGGEVTKQDFTILNAVLGTRYAPFDPLVFDWLSAPDRVTSRHHS